MPTTPESQLPSSESGGFDRRGSRGVLQPAIRIVLALLGALAGYQLADRMRISSFAPDLSQNGKVVWLVVFTAAGLVLGYLLGVVLSRLLRRGLDHVDEVMARATGAEVVVAVGGVVVGLFIATLISLALVRIPIVGPYLTVPIYLLAGYFTAYVAAKKHVEILRLLGVRGAFEVIPGITPAKLLDSSAIIDGRILDIVETGFIEGELLVPRFVIEELQRLADSADAEKRVRGRRGLDFVRRLQNSSGAVRIDGADYPDIEAVDARLVRLGHDLGAMIISTDYTLKKVAEIQGVKVLNINDLANSVKPAVLPGEVIEVKILREGREQDQGVGYLDDGTMIVVEAGSSLVGSRVKAEVTSVLQSPSGKMIFSRVSSAPPADG
ncbi:MAG: TRAM domain-containing protein [Actinobacteria bacterium]|nr:TRAM domain-containing protein [Actinomycetota bacterium]